jgi:hypothetical protein
VGFETTNSAGELPQTYAFDRMATGTSLVEKTLQYLLGELSGTKK